MSTRTSHTIRALVIAALGLLALALPTAASAAHRAGAVVFSQSWTATEGGKEVKEGGLFAVRDGHQNQLTEDPADTEPSFSADGRTIAFAREGDIYTVRPDGSGERQITHDGTDSHPQIAPNGRYVMFERAEGEGVPTELYTASIDGGSVHGLAFGPEEDTEASFSPDGSKIVFVRHLTTALGRAEDDLFSIRPNGTGLTRLTSTSRYDEFDPRYFAGGIVYSRGKQAEGAAGYADVYTMKANGTKVKPLVEGVGSAYVEDVSPQGHTLIFRRDRGLWVKQIGPGRAKKVAELPDGARTNSVFSSDGKTVATLIETRGEQQLMAVNLATGRKSTLAAAYHEGEAEDAFGPVIDWQPVR